MNKTPNRWFYVALYYGLAVAISLPFNLKSLSQALGLQRGISPTWHPWLFAPATLGPLIAALLCYRWDRTTPRRMSLLGQDRLASYLTALVPLAAFTIAGLVTPTGRPGGVLLMALSPCLAVLYALGEEVGWRGYLQDALDAVPSAQRYLIVGVLWWAWHARFSNTFEWTIFPLIVIGSAFLLGRVAQETRSVLVTASMHATIMLLTMNGSVSSAYYIAGAITILGWVSIRRFRPLPID